MVIKYNIPVNNNTQIHAYKVSIVSSDPTCVFEKTGAWKIFNKIWSTKWSQGVQKMTLHCKYSGERVADDVNQRPVAWSAQSMLPERPGDQNHDSLDGYNNDAAVKILWSLLVLKLFSPCTDVGRNRGLGGVSPVQCWHCRDHGDWNTFSLKPNCHAVSFHSFRAQQIEGLWTTIWYGGWFTHICPSCPEISPRWSIILGLMMMICWHN